jgi:predicted RND superfamily exporter protein
MTERPSFTSRIAEFLIAWRWPLFGLAVVATLASLWPARNLGFDRSVENMFSPDDPLLPPYQKLQRTFGGNEVVLAVYVDSDLMNADGSGLERLDEVGARLRKVEGVRDVLSLADLNKSLGTMQGVTNLFLGNKWKGREILDPENEAARRFRELFAGYTHSVDGKTAAVACVLIPEPDAPAKREVTIGDMRKIMEELPQDGLAPGMLVGEPVMVAEGFRELEVDGQRLGITSTILLAITILLCFRSLRWVLAPIAVVQATLVLTRAALWLAGLRLSMVSSMLTAIVTVVGIGTMVHLIVGFREARRTGLSPAAALAQAGALLAAPIFWSIMTDVAGFGSLAISGVAPVRDFGTMSAAGSFVVLISIALLLPVLALTFRFDADPRQAWGEAGLDLGLSQLIRWVGRRPKTVGALALVLSLLAAAGAMRLEVETDFTRNFRSTSQVARSYDYVETRLGGAGVWDILVPAPAALTDEYLARVRALEEKLRALEIPAQFPGAGEPGLTKVISLADADEAAKGNQLLAAMPLAIRLQGMKTAMPTFMGTLHGQDPNDEAQYYVHIMLRSHERQTAPQKKWLIDTVRQLAAESFPETEGSPPAEVTGFFVVLTNIIESISRDQWTTFAAAGAGIFVLVLVAFRSPTLALVALAPNALPIFMVMGLLGWLGLKINMGAAMIAAVSMGLSVDSSIHYISGFRRARGEGRTVDEALAAVQKTVGRAMAFSTLALIIGFSVLSTSQFVPTIYFGCLVSLAMLGGMFGNLVVLPLLLKLVTRERASSIKQTD